MVCVHVCVLSHVRACVCGVGKILGGEGRPRVHGTGTGNVSVIKYGEHLT